eukprot:1489051-Rhodomonas_salina.6
MTWLHGTNARMSSMVSIRAAMTLAMKRGRIATLAPSSIAIAHSAASGCPQSPCAGTNLPVIALTSFPRESAWMCEYWLGSGVQAGGAIIMSSKVAM